MSSSTTASSSSSSVPPAPEVQPSGGNGNDPRSSKSGEGIFRRLTGVVRRNPIKSIAVTGLVAAAAYRHFSKEDEEKEDAKKPKVLVLPFHRMKLVEKVDPRTMARQRLESFLNSSSNRKDYDTSPIEMEVDTLVEVIHKAAADPNIVALYGTFGHGYGFSAGGWAHVEEVRNALRVFRESHRVHREPNLTHEPIIMKRHGNGTPKPLYAYADTFQNPASGAAGIREYYLATIFTHIQLQPQGSLNLIGLHTTNTFYKEFLEKYGIKVHVFKHGLYKNFANQFTEKCYTKEHKENVENILLSINQQVCHAMYHSRPLLLSQYEFKNFWSTIQNKAGNFSAELAHKVGLIDYMPKLDPFDQLLLSNKSLETKQQMKEKWGKEVDMDLFVAQDSILVTEYAKKVKKEKDRSKQKWDMFQQMKDYTEQSTAAQTICRLFGYSSPNYNIAKSEFSDAKVEGSNEKIAIIKIGGPITDATARKTEKALRKLKTAKDVKCLVLRVDSPGGAITACETIYQELQDLPQKVVVSFGNVSASGGYYISSGSDRIFASPTTITGSIGVFALRLDLRGLAEQWGVKFDSVKTSELSGSFDPFYPMNDLMKEKFAEFADNAYWHFKSLVSTGRAMDMDLVESIAQGRVWTGEQAKELGLVDELGGLDRAIAYAQRNFTKSGTAQVIVWPPAETFWDKLNLATQQGNNEGAYDLLIPSVLFSVLANAVSGKPVVDGCVRSSGLSLTGDGKAFPAALSGTMLTADENSAIRCLVDDSKVPDLLSQLPPWFWD